MRLDPAEASRRLAKAHSIIRAAGGTMSPVKYLGTKYKYTVICSAGHRIETALGTILREHGCPRCAVRERRKLKNGLEQAQSLAAKRGGSCLEQEYRTAATPMEFRCALGHTWKAALSDIKKGGWCPYCTWRIAENYARLTLEQILRMPFRSTRGLPWLISETGHRMELDGYNADIGLGFEYQGQYHYAHSSFFHTNKPLSEVAKRDSLKRELCLKYGVKLIEIPYTVPFSEMPAFFVEELKKLGFEGLIKNTSTFDYGDLHAKSSGKLKMEDLAAICAAKGGRLISESWLGSNHKYEVECSCGYRWGALSGNLERGTWCPRCKPQKIGLSHLDRDGLEKLQSHCNRLGGRLISESYAGVNLKHVFECSSGHIWRAAPSDIYKGTWCRFCWHDELKRTTVNKLEAAVRSFGATINVADYRGNGVPIAVTCAIGHSLLIRPHNILSGKQRSCWKCKKERKAHANHPTDTRNHATNEAQSEDLRDTSSSPRAGPPGGRHHDPGQDCGLPGPDGT